MSDSKKTLGQAIDEVITALEPLPEPLRMTAVRAACEVLGLTDVDATSVRGPLTGDDGPPEAIHHELVERSIVGAKDIRSLKEEKEPKTAQEMACIIAYYLETLAPSKERKTDITKTDLEKYFKQGKYKLPKRIEQVLIDAKAAGYFDSAGRGRYKLNPVGYNLVVHGLPRTKS